MNTLFADTIKNLRMKKGFSQSQLANLMFVNKATISKWESGTRLPDAAMITRLARAHPRLQFVDSGGGRAKRHDHRL